MVDIVDYVYICTLKNPIANMSHALPVHYHDELINNGIHTKIVTPAEINSQPVDYAHRDDYYIFGIIIGGHLKCSIDFKEYNLRSGDIHFIRPGQVHRFIDSENFEGWMLMAESSLVDSSYKYIFDEVAVKGIPANVSTSESEELKSLFRIIHERNGNGVDYPVIRNLVSAFIGLLAEKFKKVCGQSTVCNNRQLEIVILLNSHLETDMANSHSPSYYAEKLHISPVYLNEVVKNVTGLSVGSYIRNEIVLRAKRLLYHTDMTIKEIASSLGFEDNAYFTRLFTKATGRSPGKFRRKP